MLPPIVIDVHQVEASKVWVLLIQRKAEPFQGSWALPGGFVDENEALEVAAGRELQEETGVEGQTFSTSHTCHRDLLNARLSFLFECSPSAIRFVS